MSQSASGQAVAALVAGITSWFLFPVIGGIVAVILGKMELNAIATGKSSPAGQSLAQVGFWLGAINLVLTVVGCVVSALIAIFVPAIFTAIMVGLGFAAQV